MRLPIPAVRKTSGTDLKRWADDEAVPALLKTREILHRTAREKVRQGVVTVSTDELWRSEMPANGLWIVEASVTGVGLTNYALYVVRGKFRSVGGVVTQLGSTDFLTSEESAVGFDVAFTIDGRHVVLSAVTAVAPMTWTAFIETVEGLL